MNLSMFWVKPYNNKFDWRGLLVLFSLEIGILVVLLTVKAIMNRKNREGATTRLSKALDIVILIGYIAAIMSQTWFMNSRIYVKRINLDLFWSYRMSLGWSNGLQIENSRIMEQICLNILMFVPLGFLLPELFTYYAEKTWKVIIAGCLFSAVIEVGQYVLHVGLCELDDVLNNTIGCYLGLLIWTIIRKVCSRVVLCRQELASH